MSSFTRTIPSSTSESFVHRVLSRSDHYLPLAYRPTRANPGDFIYLVYLGLIVGRVRITGIHPVEEGTSPGEEPYPDWARWVIRYQGNWEHPPREIPVQGHQSVRYLESHSLEHLDHERW